MRRPAGARPEILYWKGQRGVGFLGSGAFSHPLTPSAKVWGNGVRSPVVRGKVLAKL